MSSSSSFSRAAFDKLILRFKKFDVTKAEFVKGIVKYALEIYRNNSNICTATMSVGRRRPLRVGKHVRWGSGRGVLPARASGRTIAGGSWW